jgi:hypothetical protein
MERDFEELEFSTQIEAEAPLAPNKKKSRD